jgi:hypothetical protein
MTLPIDEKTEPELRAEEPEIEDGDEDEKEAGSEEEHENNFD